MDLRSIKAWGALVCALALAGCASPVALPEPEPEPEPAEPPAPRDLTPPELEILEPAPGAFLPPDVVVVRVQPAWWRFRGLNAMDRLKQRVVGQLDLPGDSMVFLTEDRFVRGFSFEALAERVAAIPGAVVYRRAGKA